MCVPCSESEEIGVFIRVVLLGSIRQSVKTVSKRVVFETVYQ